MAVAHVLKVELSVYEIGLTGPESGPGKGYLGAVSADTTLSALNSYRASFAINASYFSPFEDKHLFDFYPRSGDEVYTVGYSFDGRSVYGRPANDWPKLRVLTSGELIVSHQGELEPANGLEHLKIAVSGPAVLLASGVVNVGEEDGRRYPRAAIGFNKAQTHLWLVVVDGKQPGYSMGLTLREFAEFMQGLGVDNALQLDGGGSATLAWRDVQGRATLLNRPIHTKIPMRQRPVANHLLLFKR